MVKYLRDSGFKIASVGTTAIPPSGRTVSGYGNKLATGYLMWLSNGRKYRVYAICHSNAASHYITVKGERLFISTELDC